MAGMRALSFFGGKKTTTNKESMDAALAKQTHMERSSSGEHEQSLNTTIKRKRTAATTPNSSLRSRGCRRRVTASAATATASAGAAATTTGGGVSFADFAEIQPTISLEDYKPQEVYDTWYTKREYQEIKKSCCKQVCKLEIGGKLRDQKYCSRGLENLTKVAQKAKLRTRYDSIQVVLDQQQQEYYVSNLLSLEDDVGCCQEEYYQRVVVVENYYEEDIATVYKQITLSCQLWATAVGLADAMEVESFDLDDILLEGFNHIDDHHVDDDDVAAKNDNKGILQVPSRRKDDEASISSSSLKSFSSVTTVQTMKASSDLPSTSSSRCIPAAPILGSTEFYRLTPEMARSA